MTGKGLIGVALGLVTFIVVQELVESLVTGTDTASTIIQNILSLGLLTAGALASNRYCKIGRIRGNLNWRAVC
jgi:hypothetical protein